MTMVSQEETPFCFAFGSEGLDVFEGQPIEEDKTKTVYNIFSIGEGSHT